MDSTAAKATEVISECPRDIAASLLRLIDACDNFQYSIPGTATSKSPTSEYYLFSILTSWSAECTTLQTVGYILPFVVTRMPWTPHFKLDHTKRIISIPFRPDHSESKIIANQLAIARERKSFTVLHGWHDELYQLLGIKNRLVEMERAGTPLFGIATRGAHCTAYTYTNVSSSGQPTSPPTKKSHLPTLIIPFRAAHKSSYPGMLDNTIAGGTSSRESPWVAFLREAGEEVGLAPPIAARAVPTGTMSYWHMRDSRAGGETGLIQPEIQYLYDLELDLSVENEQMRAIDGEVGGFMYLSFAEAWTQLLADRFKPNCGLVLIEFFIRWGYIRAKGDEIGDGRANERSDSGDGGEDDAILAEIKKLPPREGFEIPAQEYAEILTRLHRTIAFEDVNGRL